MFVEKKVCSLVVVVFLLTFASCSHPKRDGFVHAADEYNKKCPIVVADHIVCDSMKYDASNNINTYYYTLSGALDNLMTIQQNKSQMEEALVMQVRNSVDLKAYKDFNTVLQYVYLSSTSHQPLFKVMITPRMYK